jgi:hypothetical protein
MDEKQKNCEQLSENKMRWLWKTPKIAATETDDDQNKQAGHESPSLFFSSSILMTICEFFHISYILFLSKTFFVNLASSYFLKSLNYLA